MSAKADLKEFLELYESTIRRKELPEEEWAPMLLPLLNDKFRGTAVKLPPEIKDNYQDLKSALLERDDQHMKNPAATFWSLQKE